jgi:aryl-alcohol dehydrogenase-like predicted oxidoreductase
LHNPEYFLADASKRGQGPIGVTRDEFYRRLEVAFRYLESEIAKGRITAYGVSSNTVIGAANARDTTELSRMLAAARAAAPDGHHFEVLQLPLNLLESAALFGVDASESVLATAQHARLAVLVNRPLNAIQGGSILRLASPDLPTNSGKFELARTNLLALEREFRSTIAPALELGKGLEVDDLFAWGDRIVEIEPRVESLVQWQEIESHLIAPELGKVLRALDGALTGDLAERFKDFRGRYLRDLEALFLATRVRAAERSKNRLDVIERALAPALDPSMRDEPLSRQALVLLRSLPGVTSVLLGARQPRYVEDALAALALPKLSDPVAGFAALRSP